MSYPVFKARHVMGSLTQLNTKDHQGNPEANENKHHWFVGFAVPKGAEWDALWDHMYQTAANDPACTQALCGQQGFNWKIEDCDAPENPQNLGKPSYPAGHMLIKFTRYKVMGVPPIVDGNHQPIVNINSVKKGDYYYVAASTKFNGAATVKTNAGMYQNLDGLMYAGPGEEIISEGSFNASNAFAGVQGATVQGGGAATPPTPQAQAAPTPQATVQPAHDLVQPQTPQATVQPAHDLVQPQTPGNAEAPPVLAPEPTEESYIVNGKTYTRSQLLAMPGWTEAHLAGLQKA